VDLAVERIGVGTGRRKNSKGEIEQRTHPRHLSDTARRVRELSIAQWGVNRAVEIVGQSSVFLDIQRKLEKAASFEEPVLISGESGVGKELLAQSIYLLGPRCGKPFVSVNCPQYQDGNLTVSELFGHKKGSFTGATMDRKGCFETAKGGAIFLDEIGHLHMSAQLMLLRALGYGEFQPLGSDESRRVDLRVIAASIRPLEREVVENHFRNDLFFRLRYFVLKVPPLRDRGDDWRLLLGHTLAKLFCQYGVRKKLSPASLRLLGQYDWPGNVRELISVATIGYAMSDGEVIEPDDFVSLLSESGSTLGDQTKDPYQQMVMGESFWKAVRAPFMERELNRKQVRRVIKRGLRETGSSYRGLLKLFNVGDEEYQRLMDFLRHHQLKP